MPAAFRVSFELAPPEEVQHAADARWSLSVADPAARILSGSFKASDGESVPYRLWQAKTPRGLILLLHGATDYSAAFDEIGPWLAARGLTALAIDQRGFGATASRGRWSGKKRMIRDAIEAALFLRLRYGDALRLFVLGESMGAALAVHMAARAPDLDLSGLLLAAPGAISGAWRRVFGSALTRFLRFFAPASGIVIERVSAWNLTPGAAIRLLSDPLVLRRVRPAMLFGLFKLSNSAVEKAERVRVPCLTMVGSKEELLREACIAQLHRNLKGEKSWQCFEGGPHLLLHWKNNERVLDAIAAWLLPRLTQSPRSTKLRLAAARP